MTRPNKSDLAFTYMSLKIGSHDNMSSLNWSSNSWPAWLMISKSDTAANILYMECMPKINILIRPHSMFTHCWAWQFWALVWQITLFGEEVIQKWNSLIYFWQSHKEIENYHDALICCLSLHAVWELSQQHLLLVLQWQKEAAIATILGLSQQWQPSFFTNPDL